MKPTETGSLPIGSTTTIDGPIALISIDGNFREECKRLTYIAAAWTDNRTIKTFAVVKLSNMKDAEQAAVQVGKDLKVSARLEIVATEGLDIDYMKDLNN